MRPAVVARQALALMLLAALLSAGCTGLPTDGEGQGIVVTSQPLHDAFLRLEADQHPVGVPDWIILDEPTPATTLGRPFTIPAEEVLALQPRLVLDQPHPLVSGPDRDAMRSSAERAGIEVEVVATAPELATIDATVRSVARATGQDPGPTLTEIHRSLDELANATADLQSPRVLFLFPAGLTAGHATDVDVILELAGVTNVAAEAGLDGYRQISDEAIQRADVDLVIATATMRQTPAEIASKPMLEGTPVDGNTSRVLIVDPSRTARLGPYTDQAAWAIAAWAHDGIPGPRADVWLTKSRLPACSTTELVVPEGQDTTATLAGSSIDPGTFQVPDLPDGHYRLTTTTQGPDGATPIDLILTVEGTQCAEA